MITWKPCYIASTDLRCSLKIQKRNFYWEDDRKKENRCNQDREISNFEFSYRMWFLIYYYYYTISKALYTIYYTILTKNLDPFICTAPIPAMLAMACGPHTCINCAEQSSTCVLMTSNSVRMIDPIPPTLNCGLSFATWPIWPMMCTHTNIESIYYRYIPSAL
jgi:hypothetical protein